ncbi:thioesterase family protein [Paracoccus pantotrophus]|uniref:thioesterase family protein n=1 Tax=Paracoccus pantotrophus TaxID=82367 RepID=UPI00048DB273|nr:thioesterase family protein [Paracoccus pantotrophus]
MSFSEGPRKLWSGKVLPNWLDYNGHMTEHRYLQVFGESSDAFYQLIGIDFEKADEGAFFTMQTHIHHLAECKVDTTLWSDTQLLAYDAKRLHLYHRLFDKDGALLATGEHLAIHVRHSKASEIPPEILGRVATFFDEDAHRAVPEGIGSVLKKQLARSRNPH